jgi:hypothetical protein
MVDLKKMTEELVERYLSGRDVPFRNPDITRAIQSAHGTWLPRFAYDLARQVAEACLNASIDKARIRHSELVAMDVQDLKREICGEKEAGNDQG